MGGVQLSQGYRRYVPRNSWYSFDRPRKDERLSRPWNHPVGLNTGPLDWESSTLTTRPLRNFLVLILYGHKALHSFFPTHNLSITTYQKYPRDMLLNSF